MLPSAVGKTHDLRSDLWWTIPLHILKCKYADCILPWVNLLHGDPLRFGGREGHMLIFLWINHDGLHTPKNKWHQKGSLGAPFVKQVCKTGPLGTPFWCHFPKGHYFPIHSLYLKQSPRGTKIVPFQRKRSHLPKERSETATFCKVVLFWCSTEPFPTFFCWKTSPQGSQNGATFDGRAPFLAFFMLH